MKAVEESDEAVTLGVVARQLHCRFHGLRARVAEIDALGEIARRDAGQLFGELGEQRIIEISTGHMNQDLGLALDGAHHVRMAVTGGNDRNSGAEIKKRVAVYVLNQHALAALRHEGIVAEIGGRDKLLVKSQDFLGFGSRQGHLNFR